MHLLILLAVLGWLGRLLVQSLERLKRRERFVYRAACTLGVLSGLVTLGSGVRNDEVPDAEGLLGLLFQAGLTGLFLAFGWYLVVALLLFAWEYAAAVPFRVLARLSRAYRQSADRRRHEEQSGQEARRRAAEQARNAERQQRERSFLQSDQRRRDDARLECQLFYDRHANRLQEKFPRERLHEYFAAYLTDGHPVEAVEQRARLLLEMFQECLDGQPVGATAFPSLAEIASHFRQRRAELKALPYDQETRDSLLVAVNQQEEAAIQEFLRR